MNWQAFFAMGGYAVYVWSAYGFAALVLLWNLMTALRRRKAVLRMLGEVAVADQGGGAMRRAAPASEVRTE